MCSVSILAYRVLALTLICRFSRWTGSLAAALLDPLCYLCFLQPMTEHHGARGPAHSLGYGTPIVGDLFSKSPHQPGWSFLRTKLCWIWGFLLSSLSFQLSFIRVSTCIMVWKHIPISHILSPFSFTAISPTKSFANLILSWHQFLREHPHSEVGLEESWCVWQAFAQFSSKFGEKSFKWVCPEDIAGNIPVYLKCSGSFKIICSQFIYCGGLVLFQYGFLKPCTFHIYKCSQGERHKSLYNALDFYNTDFCIFREWGFNFWEWLKLWVE